MKLATPLLFGLIIYALLLVITVEGKLDLNKKVPAIYVFGDSTADVGNNKYLPGNNSSADSLPYGIDYPTKKPTGRFSNGYNAIDYLAKHMGLPESPPPYLSDRNKTWEEGVSFASGGSGILNSTGPGKLSMAQQIEYFAKVRQDIINEFGNDTAAYLFSKSVFLISSGGNDFFALFTSNVTLPKYLKFQKDFTSNYANHLKKLYRLGARKFAIIDVPLLGCIPGSRYFKKTDDGCFDFFNTLVQPVNILVKSVVLRKLSSDLKGMEYSVGSSYDLIKDIIAHPSSYGINEAKKACCGYGRLNVEHGCNSTSIPCDERNHTLFWDSVHPTMKTAEVAASAFFNSPQFATPITFKKLVEDGN